MVILAADTHEGIIVICRRVMQSIADAPAWLYFAVVRCAHFLGHYLDGIAACVPELHGLPPDWSRLSSGEPAEETIRPAHFAFDILLNKKDDLQKVAPTNVIVGESTERSMPGRL